MKRQLDAGALPIKDALIKVMRSKAGSSKIADAVLNGLMGTFKGDKNMLPKITIDFVSKSPQW